MTLPALTVEESLRAHLNWGDKPLRPWQENVVFVVQAREALAREAAQRKLDEVEKALSGLLAVTEKRGDAAKFLAVGKAEAVLGSRVALEARPEKPETQVVPTASRLVSRGCECLAERNPATTQQGRRAKTRGPK